MWAGSILYTVKSLSNIMDACKGPMLDVRDGIIEVAAAWRAGVGRHVLGDLRVFSRKNWGATRGKESDESWRKE